MNNTNEQDHSCIKRLLRSIHNFKSETAASIALFDIDLIHMMRKQQGVLSAADALSNKQRFEAHAA